jgi:hypothetical protein
MAAPLQSYTKQEMRSVIRFHNAESAIPAEIYISILAKYGASCISKTQVYEWVRKFKNGVQNVEGFPRSGQAHRVITPQISVLLIHDALNLVSILV